MHIIVYYTSDKCIPVAISLHKNVALLWSSVKELGNLGCFCIVLLYAVPNSPLRTVVKYFVLVL